MAQTATAAIQGNCRIAATTLFRSASPPACETIIVTQGQVTTLVSTMLLRCTEKLASKLKAVPAVADDAGDSPLGCWHANLIRIDRVQCVMFCHDETRFCLFLPKVNAQQFLELAQLHRELFRSVLVSQGLPEAAIERAVQSLGPLSIDRSTNRSVLALINRTTQDVKDGFRHGLPHVLQMDSIRISRWLNERPTTVGGGEWLWPETLMAERVLRL